MLGLVGVYIQCRVFTYMYVQYCFDVVRISHSQHLCFSPHFTCCVGHGQWWSLQRTT
jgi:hypothetical protein